MVVPKEEKTSTVDVIPKESPYPGEGIFLVISVNQ